jgi:hypothetical protein
MGNLDPTGPVKHALTQRRRTCHSNSKGTLHHHSVWSGPRIPKIAVGFASPPNRTNPQLTMTIAIQSKNLGMGATQWALQL